MSYNLTKQEIFDKVATHLFKQGHRSMNEDGVCLYHGENGDMCAVGVLIRGEDYDATMEGKGVDKLSTAKCAPEPLKKFLRNNSNLLSSLQNIHDGGSNNDPFASESTLRHKLTTVAAVYNLSPAILADLHFPEKSE